MNGTVICGVDDSGSAAGAAHVARELAARLELPLVFVHVLEEGAGPEEALVAERLLVQLAGDDAGWESHAGHAADRLVGLAAERDAALVVLGCNGPRSSLLGSISADVSRRAPCPVVVVPTTVAWAQDERAAVASG